MRTLILFFMFTTWAKPAWSAGHRGNGGNLVRILEKEGRLRAAEIVQSVPPSELNLVGIIPSHIKAYGVDKKKLAEWYDENRLDFIKLLLNLPVNTSDFDKVVDEAHKNDDAYTRREIGFPVYFNTNSIRINDATDAAWLWINEAVHHIPDSQKTIDRSSWTQSAEDDFSALITTLIKGSYSWAAIELGANDGTLRDLMKSIDDANLSYFRRILEDNPNINVNQTLEWGDTKNTSPLMRSFRKLMVNGTPRQAYAIYAVMIRELLEVGATVDALVGEYSVFDYINDDGYFRHFSKRSRELLMSLVESSEEEFRIFSVEKLLYNYAPKNADLDFLKYLLSYEPQDYFVSQGIASADFPKIPTENLKYLISEGLSDSKFLTELLFFNSGFILKKDSREIAELLIDKGADIYGKTNRDEKGHDIHLLHLAAGYSDLSYNLWGNGQNPRENSQTVMDYLELLDQKTDIRSQINTRSQVAPSPTRSSRGNAAGQGYFLRTSWGLAELTPLGRLLVNFAKKTESIKNHDDMEAYSEHSKKMLEKLKSWGADFNADQVTKASGSSVETPLTTVVFHVPSDRLTRLLPQTANYLVEQLLDLGSDPLKTNELGQTPYLFASFYVDLYQKVCGRWANHRQQGSAYRKMLANYEGLKKILEDHGGGVKSGKIRYLEANCHDLDDGSSIPQLDIVRFNTANDGGGYVYE